MTLRILLFLFPHAHTQGSSCSTVNPCWQWRRVLPSEWTKLYRIEVIFNNKANDFAVYLTEAVNRRKYASAYTQENWKAQHNVYISSVPTTRTTTKCTESPKTERNQPKNKREQIQHANMWVMWVDLLVCKFVNVCKVLQLCVVYGTRFQRNIGRSDAENRDTVRPRNWYRLKLPLSTSFGQSTSECKA